MFIRAISVFLFTVFLLYDFAYAGFYGTISNSSIYESSSGYKYNAYENAITELLFYNNVSGVNDVLNVNKFNIVNDSNVSTPFSSDSINFNVVGIGYNFLLNRVKNNTLRLELNYYIKPSYLYDFAIETNDKAEVFIFSKSSGNGGGGVIPPICIPEPPFYDNCNTKYNIDNTTTIAQYVNAISAGAFVTEQMIFNMELMYDTLFIADIEYYGNRIRQVKVTVGAGALINERNIQLKNGEIEIKTEGIYYDENNKEQVVDSSITKANIVSYYYGRNYVVYPYIIVGLLIKPIENFDFFVNYKNYYNLQSSYNIVIKAEDISVSGDKIYSNIKWNGINAEVSKKIESSFNIGINYYF